MNAETVLQALEAARPPRSEAAQYLAWLRTARALADALADAGLAERPKLYTRLGLRYLSAVHRPASRDQGSALDGVL